MRRAKGQVEAWLGRTAELPTDPGVYLMRDRSGTVIYVGKAKNLRSRVRSYFQEGTSDYRAFVGLLGHILGDLETIVTRSEKEALLLERELIRQHEPRFNVIWRDDKQYLCLRIDTEHEYPWVEVVRHMGKDGARYFGPFHSASAARQTLRVVNRHFQLRTCRDSVLYHRTRPCLEFQIGRCPAPCVVEVDRDRYHENVEDVLTFLEGRAPELVKKLEARMWEAANTERFEVAARTRDQLRAIEKTLEPQHVALSSLRDQDVIGLHRMGNDFAVAVIEVREGRIRDVRSTVSEDAPFSDEDMLESFLVQLYAQRDDVPEEVLVSIPLPSAATLAEILSERRGRKVIVSAPQRGERARVLELAEDNAAHALAERHKSSGAVERTLEGLRRKLHLAKLPRRIECFDISNLQGRMIVGSKVVFVDGRPAKAAYRRYKIKSTSTQDDFKSMYEVLSRRLQRGVEERDLPDLVVIDGGKGQLGVAKAAMQDVGVMGLDVIGLAKSRVLGGGPGEEASERSPERVFLLGAKDPIVLRQSTPEILLLARIRDEAHRFAITFHRQLRNRATLRSGLEEIPGIGAARRRALLSHLGSLERVKAASLEALEAVPGLPRTAAERVYRHFHPRAETEV